MSRATARSVLDQFNLRPALVAQRYLAIPNISGKEVTTGGIMADVREIAQADPVQQIDLATTRRSEIAAAYGFTESNTDKPFVFANGKAIIPVHGILINRFSYSWSFVTGYNFIRAQVAAALADPDVDGIVYDVNTYGGMVAGCSETADIIWRASKAQGGKPSLAVIDANCYSAGYYLMSAADSIAITPTGGCGSIGVMMMHMDVSKAMEEFGVTITLLYEGDHKVDGNPYEPLPAAVRDEFQGELAKMYDQFVSAVVRNRPILTIPAVENTEARCYWADDALELQLVDTIQTPPEAMEMFFSDAALSDDDGDADDNDVPDETRPDDVADPDDDDDGDDDGDGDRRQEQEGNDPMATAPAATPTVDAAAIAASARTAERARVQGILGHPEAADRGALANHLAMATDMTVEAAAEILKASAKETKPVVQAAAAPAAAPASVQETNHFRAAMQNTPNPNVGGNGDAGGDGGTEKPTAAQRILASQKKMFGAAKPPADLTARRVA